MGEIRVSRVDGLRRDGGDYFIAPEHDPDRSMGALRDRLCQYELEVNRQGAKNAKKYRGYPAGIKADGLQFVPVPLKESAGVRLKNSAACTFIPLSVTPSPTQDRGNGIAG
jgi:hypothetical protein